MKRSSVQKLRSFFQNQVGRFLATQLMHTIITAVILIGFFFGATQVGALDSVLAPAAQTAGASFTTINYQGRLADPDGAPIDNAAPGLGMTFSLYTQETGGSPVWSESHTGVAVNDGLFSVRLGSVEPLTTDLLTGDLWLGIKVGNDDEMTPREKLDAVPYAMQAGMAHTVPDGSIGIDKLSIDGDLDFGEHKLTNLSGIQPPFLIDTERPWEFRQYGTGTNIKTALRSTVDDKSFEFRTQDNEVILSVRASNGSGSYLNMNGHPIVDQGAMVEANLQTPAELAAEQIERFSEGDVLCWGDDRLELCSQSGDPLVQAVASANGKPIVIGAEVIKVLGPVQRGDMLVASATPGYAVAVADPAPGAVIAQALEGFNGGRGIIKAMIRKF